MRFTQRKTNGKVDLTRTKTMETESMTQLRKYKQWLREKRKETAIEIVSAILLLAVSYLLIKLWFAYEGFEIQW